MAGTSTTTTIVPTSTSTTSTTSTTTKLIGPAGQMKLQIQEAGKTREITVFNPGQNIISLETVSGSTDVFISIRERAPVMISFPLTLGIQLIFSSRCICLCPK